MTARKPLVVIAGQTNQLPSGDHVDIGDAAQVRTALGLDTSGLEAALPAASAALIGSRYYATDTDEVWECVSATRWRPVSPMGRAGLGGFAAGAYLESATGSVSPDIFTAGATQGSVAVVFYVRGVPAANAALFHHGRDGQTLGWAVLYVSASDYFFVTGGAGPVDVPLIVGAANPARILVGDVGTIMSLVVSKDPTTDVVRYYWKGVEYTASTVSAMTAPDAPCTHALGQTVWAGDPATTLDVLALAVWGTALDAAQMAVAAGQSANGYIPGITGLTKVLDWRASRDLVVAGRSVSRGSSPVDFTLTGTLALTPR